MKNILTLTIIILSVGLSLAQNNTKDGFIPLFDGKTLDGWTPTEDLPSAFLVENGELICRGGRAHLFYTGPLEDAEFKNFELKLQIKTMAKSNSGVYFHTRYQKTGWPEIGFEAQVNSEHSDPRKTGSLYGIVNVWAPLEVDEPFLSKVDNKGEVFMLQPKAPSTDGEWFDYHITVNNNHIVIKVNGMTTVDWTQPDNWAKDRRIGKGTIGLQAHDPTCDVHYKNIEIKVLKK